MRCRWCGQVYPDNSCLNCGGSRRRAIRVGSSRTAEELQAAFPQVPVIVSDSINGVKTAVGDSPSIVVATFGAEPQADGGYAAAVFLDGDAQLAGAQLRSAEQLVRRWFNALSLVRSGTDGGVVAVTAEPGHRAVQALVRNDVDGWSQRELADREVTGLPPTTRSAAISGSPPAVSRFVESCELEPTWRVLGPSPIATAGSKPGAVRVVVLVPTTDGVRLTRTLRAALIAGVDGSNSGRVTVRVDPPDVL